MIISEEMEKLFFNRKTLFGSSSWAGASLDSEPIFSERFSWVRSAVSFAIHQFFNQNHFFYMNTPIITGADAEGAVKCLEWRIWFKTKFQEMKTATSILHKISLAKPNQFDGFLVS